jgi:hypothetical protein
VAGNKVPLLQLGTEKVLEGKKEDFAPSTKPGNIHQGTMELGRLK